MGRQNGKWRRFAMLRTQRHQQLPAGWAEEHRGAEKCAPFEPLVITADQTHSGDIEFEATVKVDGVVGGNIRANRIVVGPGACVAGTLVARTVHVDGAVSGAIDGGRVSVGPAARVAGDVTYDLLSISNGASISGRCQDRTASNVAYLAKPARGEEPALPFNTARAAYRKSSSRLRLPIGLSQRMTVQVGSMREIWESYQKGRMHP